MNPDVDEFSDRLLAVPCPEKLLPDRLRALEVITGQAVLDEIATVITLPLAVVSPRWEQQFARDLETYGLLEAIVYFHGYPELPLALIESACALYERLAVLYSTHHAAILESEDPRIAARLHLMDGTGGGGQRHIVQGFSRPTRQAPAGIAPPARPPTDDAYRRRLPIHPDLLALLAYLGGVGPVRSLPEELLEQIAAGFMFGGTPSVQTAFFEAADTLEQFGIDVFTSDGQYVLSGLCESFNDETFGDFDRWLPCEGCGEEFLVTVSLDDVNSALLTGYWRCERCKAADATTTAPDG